MEALQAFSLLGTDARLVQPETSFSENIFPAHHSPSTYNQAAQSESKDTLSSKTVVNKVENFTRYPKRSDGYFSFYNITDESYYTSENSPISTKTRQPTTIDDPYAVPRKFLRLHLPVDSKSGQVIPLEFMENTSAFYYDEDFYRTTNGTHAIPQSSAYHKKSKLQRRSQQTTSQTSPVLNSETSSLVRSDNGKPVTKPFSQKDRYFGIEAITPDEYNERQKIAAKSAKIRENASKQ